MKSKSTMWQYGLALFSCCLYLLILSGCGQRGSLYFPPPPEKQPAEQPESQP